MKSLNCMGVGEVKVKIINCTAHDRRYIDKIGEIIEVEDKLSSKGNYTTKDGAIFLYCDCEMVQEVEKSCDNCGLNVSNGKYKVCQGEGLACSNDNFSGWQPIETAEVKKIWQTKSGKFIGINIPPMIAGATTDAPTTKQFTREDLTNEINQYCDDIKKLFIVKNQDYGMADDAFANFRKTAERIIVPFMERHGVKINITDAMYLVLSIYVDKHAVALSQTGLQGNEVAERLSDIANYSLIAKAMLKGAV